LEILMTIAPNLDDGVQSLSFRLWRIRWRLERGGVNRSW
jgi:hypothetical protein